MFNSNNYLTETGEYQTGITERHQAYEGMVNRIQSRSQQSKNRRIAQLGVAAQSEGNKMLESIGLAEAAPAAKAFIGNSAGRLINPHLRPVVNALQDTAKRVGGEAIDAGGELARTGGAMAADTARGVVRTGGEIVKAGGQAVRRGIGQLRGGVSEGEGTEMEGRALTGVRRGNPLTSGGGGEATEYAGAGRGIGGGGGAPRGLAGGNMENSAGGMTTRYNATDRASQDAAQQLGGGTQDATTASRTSTLSRAGAVDDVATPTVTDAGAVGEATGLATAEDTLETVAGTNIEDPIGWIAGIAAGVVGVVGAITGASSEKADEAKAADVANAPAPIAPPPMSSAGVGAITAQPSALSRTY